MRKIIYPNFQLNYRARSPVRIVTFATNQQTLDLMMEKIADGTHPDLPKVMERALEKYLGLESGSSSPEDRKSE